MSLATPFLVHFVPLRGGSTYTPTESGCCQAEWRSARVVPGTPQLLGKRPAFVCLPPPDSDALSTVGTACPAFVHRFLEVAKTRPIYSSVGPRRVLSSPDTQHRRRWVPPSVRVERSCQSTCVLLQTSAIPTGPSQMTSGFLTPLLL